MALSTFSVEKLYGSYSYRFNIDHDVNTFMLTGPNGYGKTTILNIIENISEANLLYFYNLIFSKIYLCFDNNIIITITSEKVHEDDSVNSDIQISSSKRVEFAYSDGNSAVKSMHIDERLIKSATRKVGYYRRRVIDYNNFLTEGNDDTNLEAARIVDIIAKEQNQEQLIMLFKSIPLTFIKAQRLYTRIINDFDNDGKKVSSIDEIVSNLKNRMSKDYFTFLQHSQEKDSTFIDTLLSSNIEYSRDEYNKKVLKLIPAIEELRSFGLIKQINTRPFDDQHANILSAYIDELTDKISVYSQIIEKLRLFSTLIETKHFANKTVSFSPEYGLRVKAFDGQFLDVNRLSSGEQNEIIMIYNFIFEVADKSILLIDEPEISLHVAWQQDFIDDIEKIAHLKGIQVIIATHSPQVIGERWDECFDLFENNSSV